MQCKCGAEVRERNHKVITIKGAKQWLPNYDESDIEPLLPLNIEQHECVCGRYGYRVQSGLKLIFSRV